MAFAMAGALLAPHPAVAIAVLIFTGIGIGNVAPVLFSGGGRLEPHAPGRGIAAVTTLGYAGFLAGPPAIGIAAEAVGLAGALWIVAIAGEIHDGGSFGEQHFGLEHEAIANHLDFLTLAQDFAQAAEEFGAIARQFLHLLRQGRVEALAEIGDLGLGFGILGFGSLKGFIEGGKLAARHRTTQHPTVLED